MSRSPYHLFIRPYLNTSKRTTTRSSFSAILLILVAVLACKHSTYQSPQTSSAPNTGGPVAATNNRSLPSGFKSITPASGHGEVVIGSMTGNVASAALWAALSSMASYFDAKPQVLGAVVSANDDEIHGLIDATRDGQAVRGMAYVQSSGAQCVVALVYDRADEFGQSCADLVRLAQQSLPVPAETPVSLQRTTFPDGSAVDLPEGWTASSNKGAVSGKGPQGAFDFGLSVEVYTPEAASQYYPYRPPLVAAYGDPGRELPGLWAQMRIVETPDNVQIIERTPIPWWTSGVGEMLHLQALVQGSQTEWVVLMLTNPTGMGKWMYYYSGVSSEQTSFNKNLPVLMRIWQSWKTDDRVFQERLMRAAESMQACSRIIREANAFRQDAMERSSIAWDHYIRGTWPIEDQQTHTRYVPQQDVTALVRQLNESESYERWRVVPYEELNR